jgi:hypothetical protein
MFPHKEVGTMRKRNPWLRVIVALCILGLAQLACGTEDPPDPPDPGQGPLPAAVRGGGWIPAGEAGEGKATFGFQLTCDSLTGEVRGQFQYNDHAAGIAFHGVVDDQIDGCTVTLSSASSGSDPAPGYSGYSTPQPQKARDPGDLLIALDEQSCLPVTLTGGAHRGYSHSGCLEGGNIQFWWEEE